MSDESNPVPGDLAALRTHEGVGGGQHAVKGGVEVGENVVLSVSQALAGQPTLETAGGRPVPSHLN